MTEELHTCSICGWEGLGWQVPVRIVEVPLEERQPMTVSIPISFKQDAVEERREVPGIYEARRRCGDRAACEARVLAGLEAERATEPDPMSAWVP
jgi:hypothetical protein